MNTFQYITNNMKKILIIGGTVLLVILGVFFFWSNNESPLPQELPTEGSPFGSGEGSNIQALNPSFEGEVATLPGITKEEKGGLFKLSSTPVAGFIALTRASSTTVVRYVERGTGHIFDATLPTTAGSSFAKKRVTNNTLPQIYEAYFQAGGNTVLFRSFDKETEVIKNMSLSLTAPKATSTDSLYTVTLASLRGDMDSPVVAGVNLFYVLRDSGTIGSSSLQGDNQKTIWNSGFKSWRIASLGSNLLIFTKPSASIPGYAYNLSLTGTVTKLLGPLNGLVVTPNSSGTRLLYSYSASGTTKLFSEDLGKKLSTEIMPATIADKCVWSVKEGSAFFCGTPIDGFLGAEPDGWYAGKTHFSDYIWRYDTLSEASQLILEPKAQFGVTMDVSHPALSPDEKYFVFINKLDLTLWAVRLSN